MNFMRSLIRFAIALLLWGFLVGAYMDVFAFPPLPSSFYGTVKLDGQNVQVGTIIQARINDIVIASTEVQSYQGNAVYSLIVPGDDPVSSIVEGGVVGDTIQFHIGETLADQTAVWQSGVNFNLDLTAAGEVNLPTSTLTPAPTSTTKPASTTPTPAFTSTPNPTGVIPSATKQSVSSTTQTPTVSHTTTRTEYSLASEVSPEEENQEATNASLSQETQVVGKDVQVIDKNLSSSETLTPTSNSIPDKLLKTSDSDEPANGNKGEYWLSFGVPAAVLSIIGIVLWIFHKKEPSDQQLL